MKVENRIKHEVKEEQDVVNSDKYLTFFVSEEQYALNVLNIREVLSNQAISRIPRMPEYIRGIINLRGYVVPVIDLKIKFGLGESVDSIHTSIIVAEVSTGREEFIMGLLTDGVSEVLVIEDEDIEPAPAILAKVDASLIRGIGKRNDAFIVVLDIKKVLSVEELRGITTEEAEEAVL